MSERGASRGGTKKTDPRTGEQLVRLETRDPDGPARWAAWGRRPPRAERRPPCKSEGVDEARRVTNALTLECRRSGCGALVSWQRAKADAVNALGINPMYSGAAERRRKRNKETHKLRVTAGCSGPRCTKPESYKRAKHERTQVRMAQGLADGTRILAAWPASLEDVEVWTRPATQAAVAERVLAGHEDP